MHIRADGTDEQMVVSYPEVDALNVFNGKPSVYDVDISWFFGFSGAAWSPDGRYMVFGASVVYPKPWLGDDVYGLTPRLFVADLWGIEPLRQLTDGLTFASGDWAPHWSLTEDKIVFASDRPDPPGSGLRGRLWVVNPDGTRLKRIQIGDADRSDNYYWPVWSHQRNSLTGHPQIVVHPGNQPPMILDVDLAADPPWATVLTLPEVEMDRPVWSPDDSRLLYSRRTWPSRGPSYFEITILDPMTLDERVLLRAKKRVASPDWNPVIPAQ
jgi:Tol biopolymer transport system component